MGFNRGKLGVLFTGVTIMLAAAATADLPLIQPADVAGRLASKTSAPVIIQVGPNVLFRSKHIPGAVFAGPGSRPDGLELLKSAVKDLPKEREIVLYCGCCPWDKCPNMNPAIAMLKQMGYAKVKAMYIPTNFKTDWIDRGYPVE